MSQAEATAAAEPIVAARWLTPLELTVLGAIWGASFLFMRVSAREFGALPLVEMRLTVQTRTHPATDLHLGDQLRNSVRAVCLGGATRAGRYRCDHERDRGDVHGARSIRALR